MTRTIKLYYIIALFNCKLIYVQRKIQNFLTFIGLLPLMKEKVIKLINEWPSFLPVKNFNVSFNEIIGDKLIRISILVAKK